MLLTLVATSLYAQGRDFGGRWGVDIEKTAAANPKLKGAGIGDNITIAMDAKTMTVLSTTRQGQLKNVYDLDGS